GVGGAGVPADGAVGGGAVAVEDAAAGPEARPRPLELPVAPVGLPERPGLAVEGADELQHALGVFRVAAVDVSVLEVADHAPGRQARAAVGVAPGRQAVPPVDALVEPVLLAVAPGDLVLEPPVRLLRVGGRLAGRRDLQ